MRQVLLTLALVVMLLPAGGARDEVAAAPDDIIAIVVEGVGYGHGRGMSQWGAYGWAVDQGKDWRWILDHYYGGTTLGDIGTSRIRVRLTDLDGATTVGVVSHGPGVRWGGHIRAAMYSQEISPDRFAIYGSGTLACPGAAASWTKLGEATGPVTFTSANGESPTAAPGAVLGVCGGGVTHYRGEIEVHHTTGGNRVVNDVDVEAYLRGVVPKEIAASWAAAGGGRGADAVRAQAVAARSYGRAQQRYAPYAHTCDTQSCQVYAGSATRPSATAGPVAVEYAATDAAIVATAGKVRVWPDGTVASTEFSASNGPRTAGGVFPVVDDAPGDGTSRNPNHRWTRVLDADELAARYGLGSITGASMAEAASSTFRQFDGVWFNDIVLSGTSGTFRQQAWDFRGTHGLPSPGFTVRVLRERTTNRSLGFIGDSVGVSVGGSGNDELQRVLDGTYRPVTVDAVVGRCTVSESCPGSSGVQAASQLPRDLDVVVVELGYNDWPAHFAGHIDRMMAALDARGARRVVWVNLADVRTHSDGSSYYAAANAALDAARTRWPTLAVLDWDAATNHRERPRWLSDGVHLSATGQAEFALWLRTGLLALAPSHRLAPPKRLEIPVVGRTLQRPDGTATTIPPTAAAVALNATAVRGQLRGHAVVWPCGVARPLASTVNYMDAQAVANNVIAPIGADGSVCLYSSRASDFVVDVLGWFPGGSDTAFTGARPQRLVDTRNGTGGRSTPISPDRPLRVPIAGMRAQRATGEAIVVPSGVEAAVLNVTGIAPVAETFITVWPCGVPRPLASSLNARRGHAVANGVIAQVGAGGDVCIYANRQVDVVVDLGGWFGSDTAGYTGTTPARVVDTRNGTGGTVGPVGPGTPVRIPVRGLALRDGAGRVHIPASANAVYLNLTAVGPPTHGFATVWPCGTDRPLASSLNFRPGRAVANGVIAPIGADGSVCVYVRNPSHLVVDVAGWFEGGGEGGFVSVQPARVVDTRRNLGPAPQ